MDVDVLVNARVVVVGFLVAAYGRATATQLSKPKTTAIKKGVLGLGST